MGPQAINPARRRVETDVQSVMDSIRRIVRELRLASRAAERAVGLSAAQLFVLQKLADAPARSLNELARRTRTDQSSVSVVVSRLADAGLIRRHRAGEDGRKLEIELTSRARRLLARAPVAAQDRLIDGIHRLPPRRVRQLSELLEMWIRESGLAGEAVEMFFEE